MAQSDTGNSKTDNLYSNLGGLTRTVKSDTMNQLNSVAINSGIVGVTSNDTNTWGQSKNDTLYGVNVDKGKETKAYPKNESYTTN